MLNSYYSVTTLSVTTENVVTSLRKPNENYSERIWVITNKKTIQNKIICKVAISLQIQSSNFRDQHFNSPNDFPHIILQIFLDSEELSFMSKTFFHDMMMSLKILTFPTEFLKNILMQATS